MIWMICRKELLRNFHSFRFLALLVFTLLLFTLSPFLFSVKYAEEFQKYSHGVEKSRGYGMDRGIVLYRQPNPLSFIYSGGDEKSPRSMHIVLELGIMSRDPKGYGVNLSFPQFQTIGWVFILKVVFSLFGILLTFDSISGEKERGTLALMCSNSIPRASIILGKYLGALATIMSAALMGMLFSLLVILLKGYTTLTMVSIWRLVLLVIASFAYISLFILLGLLTSSVVARSSISLLLSLSVWIIFIMVIPNLTGVIAESASNVLPEHEFARRAEAARDTAFREWKEYATKKEFRTVETASQEFARFLNDLIEDGMQIKDSYRNSVYAKEDLSINLSRLSPASEFEFACGEIIDAGVMSQRRFYSAARMRYKLYADYVREKTGKEQKYMPFLSISANVNGKIVMVGPPPKVPLPRDTSDFPAFSENNFSLGESIVNSLPNLALLVFWNVFLFLCSYNRFLKYDVR